MHSVVSQPIRATSCRWGRLVSCWLVGITTHGSSSHRYRLNKNAFKHTSAFISASPQPPNQPRLHSRHIKNHKIPLCVLRAEQTGRRDTTTGRRREREVRVKTNNKVRGRILSDLLWLTRAAAAGNRDGNLVSKWRSGEREMHNS